MNSRIRQSARTGKRTESDYTITFDSIGVQVNQRRQRIAPITMPWDEIETVTVFKRDHLTVDRLCLFAARSDEWGIELDEEMNGWQEVVKALPDYLPGCMRWEKWFHAIAFPAFATNTTQIYSRAKVRTESTGGHF
jgi:hypothetical protein